MTNLSLIYHQNAGIYHLAGRRAKCQVLQSSDNRPTFVPNRPIQGIMATPHNLSTIYRRSAEIYRLTENRQERQA
ncbi:MAG: hypothetical protein HN341_10910 [Verrucomicrobia bacterium]|nr:hypothetical protein [Verrucomicrobiota bacterium]